MGKKITNFRLCRIKQVWWVREKLNKKKKKIFVSSTQRNPQLTQLQVCH